MRSQDLFSLLFAACALIFLLVGFSAGYFYKYGQNKACMNNPIVYGIKQVNELNEDYFMCDCRSEKKSRFYFDQQGIVLKESIDESEKISVNLEESVNG